MNLMIIDFVEDINNNFAEYFQKGKVNVDQIFNFSNFHGLNRMRRRRGW